MKEFDPILSQSDKTKIVNEKQVDYQKKLLGTTNRYNGHIVFEINCNNGEIKEAEFENERVEFVPNRCLLTGAIIGNSPIKKMDIICRENCLYISALNKKSALKKFFKHIAETSKKQK